MIIPINIQNVVTFFCTKNKLSFLYEMFISLQTNIPITKTKILLMYPSNPEVDPITRPTSSVSV